MKKDKLPVGEKYTLSISEAAQYFGIGVKKMRRLARTFGDRRHPEHLHSLGP